MLAVYERVGCGDTGSGWSCWIAGYFGESIDCEGLGSVKLGLELCDDADGVECGHGVLVVLARLAVAVDMEDAHGGFVWDTCDSGCGEWRLTACDEVFHVSDGVDGLHAVNNSTGISCT